MDQLSAEIKRLAAELYPRLVEIRRDFHRQPELSREEFRTTQIIRTLLEEAGFEIEPLALTTGVVATIPGPAAGPVIALRADIDALPVSEKTGLPFTSEIPGKMHACGHDIHMATVLGAAFILGRLKDRLPGSVRLIFQPAEEVGAGAAELIAAGALNGVSSIIGCHNKPDLPVGTVGLKAGPLMAAVDTLTITVGGVGGHAAIPNRVADPIVAASAVVMALQTAVSRSVSPLDSAVVSIGSFQAGAAHNVIPAEARLLGTIRTYDPATRANMPALLQRIAGGVAEGLGCTAQVEVRHDIPAVHNDAGMTALVQQAAEQLGLQVAPAQPTMGGEDFAEYQLKVPGCFFWLGGGNPAAGIDKDWHHPQFTVDEKALEHGAALFARAAFAGLEAVR